LIPGMIGHLLVIPGSVHKMLSLVVCILIFH
jgi:hypothetical protein